MKLEFWNAMRPSPKKIASLAKRSEQEGWDGIAVYDSQNLDGDCYVSLALAATATKRLGLSTGVTNSVTRHPAVTASAIASIQQLSDNRAVLGIGRGDSALAFIGHAPARPSSFENYLKAVQTYLSGEAVPFEELKFSEGIAPPVATLGLADAPEDSRITWLDPTLNKVPVEVAATGPKVIGAASRHADHIIFALGADPDRVQWGIEEARKARQDAGQDANGIKLGVYVNLICHPNLEIARELLGWGLATFARFSIMHGTTSGPISLGERSILKNLHSTFNMRNHDSAAWSRPNEFVDQFAIIGPPETCVQRIEQLGNLGIEKIIVIGANPEDGDNPEAAKAVELLTQEVLPAFRN